MNWGIVLYNLWIAITAILCMSAFILALYFFRLREKLWSFIGAILLILAIEAGDSTITLGQNYRSECRPTSKAVIGKRILIRASQCAVVFGLSAYVFSFFRPFRRKGDSQDK